MGHPSRSIIFIALIAIFVSSVAFAAEEAQPQILTPKAPPAPHINGPKVYGARPGHPFLYRIPCTGTRPIRFSAKALPSSLKLDSVTGIISGTTPPQKGEYELILVASNNFGKASRRFKIVVGDTIGLTPQMGWNDWYTFYEHPTDEVIRESAAAMISSGMADYGYQYVDIDGTWQRKRGSSDPALAGPFRDNYRDLLPNRNFPDMSALTAYIHSLGLKAGIYSSPGPVDCAGFESSYKHEDADAHEFVRWGFDLLKYDMCSYESLIKNKTQSEYIKPYAQMGAILKSLDRDVIYNLCQYGKEDVWTWARQIGGNSWRSTDDVGWIKGDTLPSFYKVGFANAEHAAYAGPGGWNDPDYILIGTVGDARNRNEPSRKTALTPNEQYSYMSMWSLMAAPLIFSGDMTRLDAFTLNVLCNSEVIDVDQDTLGKQASVIHKSAQEFILAKPLADGSVAVGLFNLTQGPVTISVDWRDLAQSGRHRVRDLWRQKDIGTFDDKFSAMVAPHGVVLVRIARAYPLEK